MKIKGKNNPSKRLDVREKISRSVTQSYVNDPDLRFGKARTYPIRSTWGRRFLDGRGNKLKSLLELNIAQLLQKLNFEYEYEPTLFFGNHYRYPDFKIDNVVIEVCGYITNKKTLKAYLKKFRSYLLNTNFDIIFIIPKDSISYFSEIQLEFEKKGRHSDVFTLEKREVELNITNLNTVSYAHFLEWYDGKCQKVHSHSSYIIDLYLQGPINSKWLLDFKEAKAISNSVLDLIDHKVIVNKKYVTFVGENGVIIDWKNRSAKLLPEDVYITKFEPTCENITCHLADLMLEKFKEFGVILLALSFREGINNGVTAYSQIKYHTLDELEKIITYHLNIHYTNKDMNQKQANEIEHFGAEFP